MSSTGTAEPRAGSRPGDFTATGPDRPAGDEPTAEQVRAWARRVRPWLLIGLAVVATGIVLGLLLGGRTPAGLLDPRSASTQGGRALAELLRDQGVAITVTESLDGAERAVGSDTTLLVTVPDLVPPDPLAGLLETAAAGVLVAPTDQALKAARLPLRESGDSPIDERAPGCELPAAVAAGSVDAGGLAYEPSAGSTRPTGSYRSCYFAAGGPTLVQVGTGPSTTTVVGSAAIFTNGRLDEHGNAALSMWLLGGQPRLVWYLPQISETSGDSSLVDLLPAGWKWGGVQLAIAVGLIALWRARRLGRLVTEPLPVVVRAAEAVEGRARLYHRARATDRAAGVLRSAARSRFQRWLGLGRSPEQSALVDAVARRTRRRPADVDALLYGATPADEAALVRLADELDALEKEVRSQ